MGMQASAPGPGHIAAQEAEAAKIAAGKQAEQARSAAIAHSTPDAIEAGGGSLTMPGYMNLASLFAGAPSDPLAQTTASQQVFGNAVGTPSFGGTGGGTGSPLSPGTGGVEGGGSPGGGMNPMFQKIIDSFLGNQQNAPLGAEFQGSYA